MPYMLFAVPELLTKFGPKAIVHRQENAIETSDEEPILHVM